MAQYEMNLRDYWLIIRRRRTIIIVCTILVAAFSFWFAKQKTPVYQATASVKFEQSTSLSGLLVEVLSYSTADSIETQASLIKSYPVLEEVARRLGRLPQSPTDSAMRESRSYQATLDAIAAKIKASRVPSTSILEITATSTNAREARDLANTVAETYRDYSKQHRNARLTEARKFIEAQLKEVETRVKRAEEEVWAFRDANRVISPGAESTVLLSLFTQVRADIEKTRQQRTELEQVQSRLARSDPRQDRVYVDSGNPAIQRLQTAQTDLMMERTALALEVTDKHPRLQAIDDRLREVRAEMRREVSAQISALRNREDILTRQMGELMHKNREVPAVELSLQRLQRDAKVNDDLLTLLKTRHQEALIKESESVDEVVLVRPAADPTIPVGTETMNTVLVGALLGLMLGLVLAFVQETLDTSIGTIEDVESYLDVPVLGIIPHIDPRETVERLVERRPGLAHMDREALQSHALLITHFDPKSPVAEAYRTLRTNVQFQRMERGGKTLVVTSPTLQEGKTTTIVNLALTMAQNGQKTLLVGANMRRPSIYRFFGIPREPGLSDILVGNADWRDCVRGVTDILMGRLEMEDVMASPGLDNLHIIEAGPIPANPSELLSAPAMSEFLRAVSAEYDIVLIDTPPILPVTDSAIVAAQTDGVLLVYQAGKIGRLVLKRAKSHLESARAKVWGVVLNDLQTEVSGYTYTHYYTHYYGEETAATPRGGLLRRALGSLGLGRGEREATRTGSRESAPVPATPRGGAAVPSRRPSRGYGHLWVGIVVMVLSLAVLAVVIVWRFDPLGSRSVPPPPLRPRPGPSSPPASPAPSRPSSTPVPRAPALPSATPAPPAPPAQAAPAPGPATPVPASAPAASRPAKASDTAVASVREVALAAAPAPAPPASPARFAIEFGPFTAVVDAERVERALTEAGLQTTRFRQRTGGAVYAVLIERVGTPDEARAIIAALQERGVAEITVAGSDPLTLRVGSPQPLRGAVALAEQVRAAGYPVRVVTQPGAATAVVVRHGNFGSRDEAETRRREIDVLGVPAHQVVQVR